MSAILSIEMSSSQAYAFFNVLDQSGFSLLKSLSSVMRNAGAVRTFFYMALHWSPGFYQSLEHPPHKNTGLGVDVFESHFIGYIAMSQHLGHIHFTPLRLGLGGKLLILPLPHWRFPEKKYWVRP